MPDPNTSLPLEPDDPTHILGCRVIGRCPHCQGEGRIWCFSTVEGVTVEWKESCPFDTCVYGYFLSEDRDDAIPF